MNLLTSALMLVLSQASLLAQEACLECHSEPDLSKMNAEGREISLFVDKTVYAASVHGDFDCLDCHVDAEEIPHAEALQPVDCGTCHDDAVSEYQKSIHANAREQGAAEAPRCSDCHGKHDIVVSSDPVSRVHPLNLASTCATCHSDPKIVRKFEIPIHDPLAAYKKSVHGVAVLSERNFDAATCTSCHGSHDIRTMNDQQSPIYWKNVPETCGQCHGEILQEYSESIHWKAGVQGIRNAPVCIDCHGEHEVKSPEDPSSPVNPLRVSAATCERCHASELISERYGIAASRVQTFENSYHGLAIKGGSLAAANCASCHGIHNILPSSDPRSLINPANLQRTCGGCHKDASENFASGPVHLTTSTTPGRVVQIVRRLYIGLIVIVVLTMLIHNGADFIRRSRSVLKQRGDA